MSTQDKLTPRELERWWHRFQIEIGIGFRLSPDSSVNASWRRHLFDPFGSWVLIGDILDNPRCQLPTFGPGYVDDISPPWERPWNDPNALRPPPIYRSRCLWIAGGIRLLGLEVGGGIFYRQRYPLQSWRADK